MVTKECAKWSSPLSWFQFQFQLHFRPDSSPFITHEGGGGQSTNRDNHSPQFNPPDPADPSKAKAKGEKPHISYQYRTCAYTRPA